MCEETSKHQAILGALRSGVVGGIGVKALASDEADVRYWQKALDGDKPDHRALARFGAAYQEFRSLDPEAALRWASGVLAAMGFDREVLSRAIEVHGTAEVRTEEMEAVAAVAKVVDAELTAAPVEVRVALAGAAVRETTEAYHALRQLQAQPSFAFGR